MPKEPLTTDAPSWHKFFASTANNRAWTLSTTTTRTPEQDQEMLDLAHASAWHWRAIGTELHHMRATMLLAEVHALLGLGASATRYAKQMHTYFTSRETDDWELAFTHAITAHAAYAAGDLATHRSAYTQAVAALDAIADSEDRAIVNQTMAQIPAP
jgi:hypothetical protein